MAINFLNDIDLNQNEAFHLVLENQANDTAAGTGIDGQLYFDTTNKQVKFYNATTAAWVALGTGTGSGTVTSVAASIGGSAYTATVSNATTAASITITPQGSSSQYIDGAGDLQTFPSIPQGDITSVIPSTAVAKLGITIANQTGPIPEVGIDIVGINNAVTNPANDDLLLIYDASGTPENKKISVSNLLAAAPQGDITGLTEGDGITITNATGPVPTIAVDYLGSDSVIGAAADGTGVTLVDADDFIFADSADSSNVKYANLSQLKTYIGAGTYSWTVAGDTGSSTVSDGETVSIRGSATGLTAGIDVTESSRVVTVKLDLSELTTNSTIDGANDEVVFYDSNAGGNAKITPADIHLSQWGAAEAAVSMGGNQINNLADPTSDQDAATRKYVDDQVIGLIDFKGDFNADTGAITGGGNLTDGATRVAISVGDMYIVTTAGDFYNNTSYPLTVGDSVICKQDAAAGTSDINDWTIVQGDEGVVDITNSNGTFVSFGTTNTNARGSVTLGSVDLSASGTPANNNYLRGDNVWATLPASDNYDYWKILGDTGSTNVDSQEEITFAGGAGITTALTGSGSSGTMTISQTSGSTGAWSGNLSGTTAGISNGTPGSGGYTTYTLTTATLFGTATNSRQVQVEVMQIAENDPSAGTPAYSTVYPAVSRASATTIEIKFKGTIANDKYYAVLSHAGNN